MTAKAKVTANDVLDVLCEKHFKAGAHEFLREVRNATGNSHRQDRYADALVIPTWPSRGIWFGGIEVKVSRQDWQRELEQPEKSDEIQKFCSYWWIATPPDVVREGELPETWGHIEVSGKACKVLRVAPKLDAQPPSVKFVASILRNASQSQQALRQAAVSEGYERAKSHFDAAEVEKLRGELVQAQRANDLATVDRDRAKQAMEEMQRQVKAFEALTGLELGHRHWRDDATRKVLAAAKHLEGLDLGRLEGVLRKLADSLGEVNAARVAQPDDAKEAAQ